MLKANKFLPSWPLAIYRQAGICLQRTVWQLNLWKPHTAFYTANVGTIVKKKGFLRSNKHLINCMEQNPPWEASRFSTSQKVSKIYWSCRFITVFARADLLSLYEATSIQFKAPTKFLLTYSRPSNRHFPFRFHSKTLYKFLLKNIRATFPTHLSFLHLIPSITVYETYRE